MLYFTTPFSYFFLFIFALGELTTMLALEMLLVPFLLSGDAFTPLICIQEKKHLYKISRNLSLG